MFFQMASFLSFMATQSFPYWRKFEHLLKSKYAGRESCLPHAAQRWALYLAVPGKAEASRCPSRPKQQLAFTATFPISAQGGSCNSHFIAVGGHMKDKASRPINKTNVLIQASFAADRRSHSALNKLLPLGRFTKTWPIVGIFTADCGRRQKWGNDLETTS